ncbi:MAG: biliverdin-producing heme oxygenase [Planctomycetota bacterium]
MTTAIATAPLSARLKESSAEAHRTIEQRPLQQQLAKGVIAEPTFSAYLQQVGRMHDAIETHLDRLIATRPEIAPLLGDDMRHSTRLSEAFPQPPANVVATTDALRCLERICDTTPAAILGAHYVLEGSMNGNRFIIRGLAHAPHLAGHPALAYFTPYGDEQPARWAAFKTCLDGLSLTDTEADAIVRTAWQVFDDLTRISDAVAARFE